MYEPDHIIAVNPVVPSSTGKTKTVILSALIVLAAFGVLTAGYLMNSTGIGFSTRATLDPVDVNILPIKTTIAPNESISINVFVAPNQNDINAINSSLSYDPAYLTPVHYESNINGARIISQGDGQFSLVFDTNCQDCVQVSESQNLYTIIFKSTGQTGDTLISLSDSAINLVDDNGNELKSDVTSSEILIR